MMNGVVGCLYNDRCEWVFKLGESFEKYLCCVFYIVCCEWGWFWGKWGVLGMGVCGGVNFFKLCFYRFFYFVGEWGV